MVSSQACVNDQPPSKPPAVMSEAFPDIPVGGDPDLNEAIRIMLSTSGFETDDLEVIKLVERALRKKLDKIASNAHFAAGISPDDERGKVITLLQLKPALNEEHIRIDRPDFILEQPQSKMTTRRSKSTK